jgi:hypothetical protein
VRSSRVIAVVAALALVGGCSNFCTEIGCVNGVTIELTNEFTVDLLPIEVTVCADDVCNTDTVDATQVAPDQPSFGIAPSLHLTSDRERDVSVSLRIRSIATDQDLINATGVGRLHRSQPNGPGCGDTCYGTTFHLDGSATTLVEG